MNVSGRAYYSLECKSFSPSASLENTRRVCEEKLFLGPCDYFIKNRPNSPVSMIRNAPRVLLGDEILKKKKSSDPIDYTPKIPQHSPFAYLLGKFLQKVEVLPGPSHYKPEPLNNKNKAPEYSIGKSIRKNIITNNFPGPGAYFIHNRSNSAEISFSRSKRNNTFFSESPGPKYSIPSTLNTTGGVIGRKYYIKNSNKSPGPGAYNSQSISPNKGFTFLKASRFEKINTSSTSPASYNIVNKSSSVFGLFAKSKRPEIFIQPSNEKTLNLMDSTIETQNSIKICSKNLKNLKNPKDFDLIVKNNSCVYSIERSKKNIKPTDLSESKNPHSKSLNTSFSSKTNDISPIRKIDKLNPSPVNNNLAYKNLKISTSSIPSFTKNIPSFPKLRSNHYSRVKKFVN